MARKARRGGIILGVIAILIIATAVAVYVGKANIKGGASSGQFSPQWTLGDTQVTSQTDMTCSANTDANMDLNVNVTDAFPGGSCTVQGAVTLPVSNAQNGKIVGLALTLPTDWTATLAPEDCGATVTRGAAEVVHFTITMGANAPLGEASTFEPTSGLRVAPVSQNATLQCSQT